MPNENLVDQIFDNNEDFYSGVILTTTNDDTLQINQAVLAKVPGETMIFNSADSVVTDNAEDAGLY